MSRRRAAESAAYMPAKPAPMMTSRICSLLWVGTLENPRATAAAAHCRQRSTTTRRRETKTPGALGGRGATPHCHGVVTCGAAASRTRRPAALKGNRPVLVEELAAIVHHDGGHEIAALKGLWRNFCFFARC